MPRSSPKEKTQGLEKDFETLWDKGTGMEGIPCIFFLLTFKGASFPNGLSRFIY